MALAIAAIGASSASASGFVAEKYPSTAEGTAGGSMVITTNSHNLSCAGNLTGAAIDSPAITTEFASKEISCGGGGKLVTNGCKLVLRPGSKIAGNEFGGSFEFAPDCKLSYTSFSCTTTFGPQAGLGASYVNSGEGKSRSVSFSAAASGVKYTSAGACAQPGTFSNGTLTGSWNIKSYSAGSQYGLWVGSPTGLFLTSGKEGEEFLSFRAEQYPVSVTNQWTSQFKLLANFNIYCNSEKIGGFLTESAWAIQMTRAAKYDGCRMSGNAATMTSNGCNTHYTLASGNPYWGFYVLSCPSGKQLEVKANEGNCTVQFPPQQLGKVEYEETGSGVGQKVLTQISGEGVEYTASGEAWCEPGSYENGGVTGAATLEAVG